MGAGVPAVAPVAAEASVSVALEGRPFELLFSKTAAFAAIAGSISSFLRLLAEAAPVGRGAASADGNLGPVVGPPVLVPVTPGTPETSGGLPGAADGNPDEVSTIGGEVQVGKLATPDMLNGVAGGTATPPICSGGISGGLVSSYSFLHLIFKSIFLPVFREVRRILKDLSQTLSFCTPIGSSVLLGGCEVFCIEGSLEFKTLCKNVGLIFKNLFSFLNFVFLLSLETISIVLTTGKTAPSLSTNSTS